MPTGVYDRSHLRIAVKIKVACKSCKQEFVAPRRKHQQRVYCSQKCLFFSRTKGVRDYWWGYKISEANKGRKLSEKHKLVLMKALEGRRKELALYGAENSRWKGDNVGYRALHNWVARHLGKPQRCDHCGNNQQRHRQYHWANKSKKYKRELVDWLRLCASCHKKFDKKL